MSLPPPLPTANPYAAPQARVVDVQETGTQELADRGTRLAAALVDGVIYGGLIGLMAIAAAAFTPKGGDANVLGPLLILLFSGGVIALFVVNCVMLHRHGQTIAKRIFKIKIVRTDGSRCGLTRVVFARWLPVAILGAIPLIGYIVSLVDPLMIFREDYRCLHDHIADTVVVKV